MPSLQPRALYARRLIFSCVLLAIGIGFSACGGGGGGGTPSSTTANPASPSGDGASNVETPPPALLPKPPINDPHAGSALTDLIISEVASNFHTNDVAWLEIHNPTEQAIGLSAYALRSAYTDTSNNSMVFAPISFALPEIEVPAGAYLVVAGRLYDRLQDNAQIVYLKQGSAVPYWNANGAIELVSAGKTVDFVRFGTSTATPLTAAAWSGANVAAMPSGPNEHGKSIVRMASGGMRDTDTAQDWTLVNFATPAGINDVEAGVIDSDRDGIPDSAKVSGGSYAGLDLYAMGARRGRRDIFLEIDYMSGTDAGITPRQEALQKMVDAFAKQNIAVHIDVGQLYSAAFNPAQFNLGGGNAVEFAACIELLATSENLRKGCTSFYDYKSRHFDVRRKLLFHYALFANSQYSDGLAGPSGVAELYGNDLIVTLGGYGFSTATERGLNMLINLQASTLMHELGHNLGLRHGGFEDANYKPNHISVMNYMYQFAGLSAAPDSGFAAERYYLANNLKGKTYCNLAENSPCTGDFKLDYSDGRSIDLDENKLSEPANIGRGSVGSAYADWNNDGLRTTAALSRNINPRDGSSRTVLRDYDEWSNLVLPFARGFAGNNSGSSFIPQKIHQANRQRANPMNQHPRYRIQEEPLPAQLHSELRNPGKERKPGHARH